VYFYDGREEFHGIVEKDIFDLHGRKSGSFGGQSDAAELFLE
jgi:hypothetical protein